MQRSKAGTTGMHELSESARRALCELDGAQRIVVAMQRSISVQGRSDFCSK